MDADASGRWLVTELIQGETLDRWARRRAGTPADFGDAHSDVLSRLTRAPEGSDDDPFDRRDLELRSVDEVVGVALELVDALRHLHSMGIVHGDITPRNVIVDAWEHVKLLDVGGTSDDAGHTPGFAAPEVLRRQGATRATDAWGLGAVLYGALAGRPPFASRDPVALAHEATTSSPVPPSAWRTDVPARLDRTIVDLLSRDPHRRPSLEEVAKVLGRHWASLPARHPVLGMERQCLASAHGPRFGGPR